MKKFLLGVDDYHEFKTAQDYFQQMGIRTSFKELEDPNDCEEEVSASKEIEDKFRLYPYVAEFTILN